MANINSYFLVDKCRINCRKFKQEEGKCSTVTHRKSREVLSQDMLIETSSIERPFKEEVSLKGSEIIGSTIEWTIRYDISPVLSMEWNYERLRNCRL